MTNDRSQIEQLLRDHARRQYAKGFVECPNACHGFGRCRYCGDTGWMKAPLAARVKLGIATDD